MNQAFRFRIYPTKEQELLLAKTFGCCRFLYNQMLNAKIEEYKKTGKMLRNTPAMYKKEYPFLKEVDSLALANVQLHLERAYELFWESGCRFSEIQVKTQKQKQLYNKYGKRKHSGGRAAAEASEAEMDPDEKAQGDPGILLSEICDGKQGTFRKILCQPVMRSA